MDFKGRVRLEGLLFEAGAVEQAIVQATKETLEPGKEIAQRYTPVRTAYLQSNWEDNDRNTIFNATPYSAWVEEGTSKMEGRFYAEKSVPEIGELYEESLSRHLRSLG
ncbi:hypothetical protein IQ268_08910 [Oculatella sp. LEGE 06141]|uniref:hypothetical protein n=1 Tax=Oculatella sp. LEGE 06141 TaxID=1828648 RepID=UPI00187EECEB|nr:hypothetical protein [Oculatella sp. LEGE 06141]MBE9178678.1 hypothetical protein [Oculatella sp. LEGE 06141]